MRTDVHWIEVPDDVSGTSAATAWLLRWDDPRIDRWLAHVPPDPADLVRFAARVDAGRRIVRRRLARLLLATAQGCLPGATRLADGQHGAAAVAAPGGWHLSLAGSGHWCAIAIAREPVGIDVEPILGEPLPPDLLIVGEREWLGETPPSELLAASLACWTAKEAHAKRLGRPRQDDPAAIDTFIDGLMGKACSSGGTSRLAFRRERAFVAAVALDA